MALVLAIESDSVRADTLRHVLGGRADTDVVVVGSKNAAVAAIDEQVPDLVLVSALMSPRDEDALVAHLRTLPDAGHLQTLTVPQLRQASGDVRRGLGVFGTRKKQRTDAAACGCDPMQFGDEVGAYLSRACEVKAAIEQRRALDAEPSVVDRPEPVGTLSSVAAEEPPHPDARRFDDPDSGLEFGQDECDGVHPRVAAPRAAWTSEAETATPLAGELDRMRAEAERTLAARLTAADERHRAEITRLETAAAESRDAAARDAHATAAAQADETLAAELDRARAEAEQTLADQLNHVRAETERTLAAQLATAEERHRAEIARLETAAAESRDAAARDAHATAEAQADETRAAKRTLAVELAAAEERHRAEIVRREAEAAAKSDAATRDAQATAAAQADETLATELDRVRAEAERTLAARLATAEERHRAEITRLETSAAESRDAAARDAHATAEAQAGKMLADELNRTRAEAERTLAAELATAEERHRADMVRLEAEAVEKSDAATLDAQAIAGAQADETPAAELDRARADAERTLADELSAAQARHYANIARMETEAPERTETATQVTRAAAEQRADETLAAELDQVRADGERIRATELALAEERHLAEIGQVRAEVRKALAETLAQIQDEAHRARETARQAAEHQETVAREARAVASRDPVLATAPSASTPPPPSLTSLNHDDVDESGVTDYYDLWRARFAAAGAHRSSPTRYDRREST